MDEPEPWQAKVWGRTRRLTEYPGGHACLAEAVATGYSSRHHHPAQSNAFFVLRGVLLVEVWDDGPAPDGWPSVTRRLAADDAYVVPAGVWHRFIVAEPVAVIETYQTTRPPPAGTPAPDIVRYDEGGVGPPPYGRAD